jgi:predicted ferric reductase
MIKYITQTRYRAAFGWGVVMAKTAAGALYPTMFFLILSMSRYFSTFLRRWYYISRFVNWDLSQKFHIVISCVALTLATLHAIGHLSGSFVFGSRPNREPAVAAIIGEDLVPRPYIDYVRSLPGFTGLTALGLFYLLALLSMPQVRRWNYEVFQLGHLLMYPIIGLLCAHGTAALLQWPMLGYFLAFPTLLVLIERVIRVFVGFRPLPATIRILDSETVEIKADIPEERVWKYRPGQYLFLQVPKLSFFQWHPFTISVCLERQVQLHIKTDGNWTKRLRSLVPEGQSEANIKIGLNGPFGAPAERFYDFTHTVLVSNEHYKC